MHTARRGHAGLSEAQTFPSRAMGMAPFELAGRNRFVLQELLIGVIQLDILARSDEDSRCCIVSH